MNGTYFVMSVLSNYVQEHTVCIRPGTSVDGELIDVHYFKVAVRNSPNVQDFIRLVKAHDSTLDFNDEQPHSYIEIGAWLGDQGAALRFMALGTAIGVFELTTPTTIGCPEPVRDEMAGLGYVLVEGVPNVW